MRNYKQLAARMGYVAAAVMLVATSAFADSRHRNETRGHGGNRNTTRHERSYTPSQSQRGNGSYHRSNPPSHNYNRSYSAPRAEGYRGGSRSYGYHGGSSHYSPYYGHGRISHVYPYHGGYRVFVAGVPLPFFVPFAYWDPFRFRVGLNINIGGYYNPAGYYDYYYGAYPPPPPPYYARGPYPAPAPAYSEAVLRGSVESVDYGNGTFVVRNEASGSFVTVDNRAQNGPQVQPGDYVEIQGDWLNGGSFHAVSLQLLNDGRDYRR